MGSLKLRLWFTVLWTLIYVLVNCCKEVNIAYVLVNCYYLVIHCVLLLMLIIITKPCTCLPLVCPDDRTCLHMSSDEGNKSGSIFFCYKKGVFLSSFYCHKSPTPSEFHLPPSIVLPLVYDTLINLNYMSWTTKDERFFVLDYFLGCNISDKSIKLVDWLPEKLLVDWLL